MAGVENKKVKDSEDGMRLDRWFKENYPDLTHGRLQKLLRTGQVRVSGARAKTSTRIESGQMIRVPPLHAPQGEPSSGQWSSMDQQDSDQKEVRIKPLSKADIEFVQGLVIHKDDDVIALNKPSGLPVQGGTNTERHLDGLLDALTFGYEERPRLVHRLDKDTSGLLLLARTRQAATALGHALKDRSAKKIYWALVKGVPRYDGGEINLPVIKKGQMGDERIRIAERDDPAAMRAVTHYRLIESAAQKLAWLAMMPVTGRTHQLRVHAVALGHPIVGDGKYGGAEAHPGGEIARKLHLHARYIEIPHPKKGILKLEAELPPHMKKTWDLLSFDSKMSCRGLDLLDLK